MMQWLKVYHEMIYDIKLRRFTVAEKWAWVVLLCLASQEKERGIITADAEDIAACCEFNSEQDWLYFRDKLITKGMIEINGDGAIAILHWEERQYEKPSDRPKEVAARVSRHRDKKRNAPVTPCNAPVTPLKRDETPQIRLDPDPDPDPDQYLSLPTLSLQNEDSAPPSRRERETIALCAKEEEMEMDGGEPEPRREPKSIRPEAIGEPEDIGSILSSEKFMAEITEPKVCPRPPWAKLDHWNPYNPAHIDSKFLKWMIDKVNRFPTIPTFPTRVALHLIEQDGDILWRDYQDVLRQREEIEAIHRNSIQAESRPPEPEPENPQDERSRLLGLLQCKWQIPALRNQVIRACKEHGFKVTEEGPQKSLEEQRI